MEQPMVPYEPVRISPINQQAWDTGLLQITRDVLHDAETVRKYPR